MSTNKAFIKVPTITEPRTAQAYYRGIVQAYNLQDTGCDLPLTPGSNFYIGMRELSRENDSVEVYFYNNNIRLSLFIVQFLSNGRYKCIIHASVEICKTRGIITQKTAVDLLNSILFSPLFPQKSLIIHNGFVCLKTAQCVLPIRIYAKINRVSFVLLHSPTLPVDNSEYPHSFGSRLPMSLRNPARFVPLDLVTAARAITANALATRDPVSLARSVEGAFNPDGEFSEAEL